MALENEIKATGNALHSLTGSERGVFMFLMLVSLGCIVFLIIYFLQSINGIVADHNKALGEQRKEFIEAQKVRDTEFVTAIYGIKNGEILNLLLQSMVSKTERELSDSFYFFTDHIMKQLWQNKAFRVLCWQMFNAGVAFLATTLTGIKGELQVAIVGLVIPLLNLVTKWINTNYFGDLGVEKKPE